MEEQVQEIKHRPEKRRKTNLISNIILVFAVFIFLFSAYKLYTIYAEYNKGDKEYKSIIEDVVSIEEAEETADTEEGDSEEKAVFQVDFAKLQSINKEVVGWIRFENPSKISYPIVQAEDNDKYLTHTVEGKKNSSGSIFMDANNTANFSDRNTFIYGHNMKNGSMFGQLRKYKNYDFYKENPYFYIYTPDGKEIKYQIYAVCIVEDTSESYNKYYTNDDEYLNYLEYIKSISRYDTGVEVTAQSQLVSLSTCTNVTETQRLLVHGVRIAEPTAEGQAEEMGE